MPSLFRFLVIVGLLSGMVYGTVFSLARYVNPTPREITFTVPADKFYKNQ